MNGSVYFNWVKYNTFSIILKFIFLYKKINTLKTIYDLNFEKNYLLIVFINYYIICLDGHQNKFIMLKNN